MPRKTKNMFSTARGRVRASMNKYNLFNLYKKPAINYQGKTLYQQKWLAKAETRAYHGEHLTESRWKELFKPNLESVAQLDASLKGVDVPETPLPLQTYAALEKRLEFALFRAMFASSIRQARQFILSGDVKVNGIVIKHPSFPLQSGDMFSVSPEKVLFALGRKKPSVEEAIRVDKKQIAAWNGYVSSAKSSPREVWEMKKTKPKSLDPFQDSVEDHKENVKKFNKSIEKNMTKTQRETSRESLLSDILSTASSAGGSESVSPDSFTSFNNTDRQKAFQVFNYLSDAKHELLDKFSVEDTKAFITKKSNEFATQEEAKLALHVKQILSELVKSRMEQIRLTAEEQKLPEYVTSLPYSPDFASNLTYHQKLDKDAIMEDESKAVVNLPWQKGLFGRQDPSKSYFTPWLPRPFLGCFAVLPSHIEVSFSTCHAVYLRDPIARPNQSEVVTPLPDHVHERAYMYYARKGL
ncbi:Piso0_004941 [Millerozyma farinosa CBS 7064]|uniref:Small ribosomal subunit protein uS4m n=1 Tax=Pichia sorbitophila (strain ATCC MYA-4447 / BCRC 22081 / CBS 7064 / NBRC 10061 / NRRL Y-12695) TaxID=559304 RepID=G8Y0U8_PICSO|nr:Piso0_004941 [Millerozyma farinosa CBS 7064]